MKKFGLIVLGIIAGIVVLTNLGSMLGLAFSVLIAYAGFHHLQKSESTLSKLFWGGVLLIGLLTAITNVPAFFGIIALIGVLYVLRKWKGSENSNVIAETSDPFDNFERQWKEIIK
ncbi:hypothetical protein OXB_1247 [Bacillus sp. OxB-1]|uniref:lmo0954 family membrane protein n=1 Tax=Bacillus sp. (strain OxB-1) TaxID=98228 RepID=UPI00058231B5|nr:hypothetical protein [Bacillus sp. OxB-1]BAQ09719.1 hypothetical protein OXB_1247 [Bacillus sp. OxB-1]